MRRKKKQVWVDPDFAKRLKKEAAEKEKCMLDFTKSITGFDTDESLFEKPKR